MTSELFEDVYQERPSQLILKYEIISPTNQKSLSLRASRRAKLFTFGETLLNKGTGTKSWNEKGLGDVKLLK
jgi:hypothetical protein